MALTIFGLTLSVSAIAQNEARLMRFPDINKNLIDLYMPAIFGL